MNLIDFDKNEIPELAVTLSKENIQYLVSNLKEKNNNLRYNSFLLLKERSKNYEDVYDYFDTFKDMLTSRNSYHKHIAVYLIAENAKYSKKYDDNKFIYVLDRYLQCCKDEKYSTARQCIQSIPLWIDCYPELIDKVTDYLINIDITIFRESGRGLVLYDIAKTIIYIRNIKSNDRIDNFLDDIINNELLDDKRLKELGMR